MGTNTKWKLSLDVGLQPGTWMPKRYPGWAESGARLGLDVAVEFTETPFTTREPLVGEKESTFQLKVCSTESVFVSERGQQSVTFLDGGWCIQRPTNDVRNAGGTLVKPEGLLKFWLDCPTGAKKRTLKFDQIPGSFLQQEFGILQKQLKSKMINIEKFYRICK